MRTITTILSITLICIVSAAKAQSIGDSLLKLEFGYWKANNEDKANLAYQRFQFMLKNGMEGDEICYREMRRVKWEKLPHSDQPIFLWNASIVSLFHDDFNSASEKLQQYALITQDHTESYQFLNLIAQSHATTSGIDTSAISKSLRPFCGCIQDEISRADTAYKKYSLFSWFLPGMGTALKGYPGRGLISLGLNGGSFSLIYLLLHSNLYFNAIGYYTLTFMKFYSGNLVLSKKLIPSKVRKKQLQRKAFCDEELGRLMKKYPYLFR